jgi:hypothetical protein
MRVQSSLMFCDENKYEGRDRARGRTTLLKVARKSCCYDAFGVRTKRLGRREKAVWKKMSGTFRITA